MCVFVCFVCVCDCVCDCVCMLVRFVVYVCIAVYFPFLTLYYLFLVDISVFRYLFLPSGLSVRVRCGVFCVCVCCVLVCCVVLGWLCVCLWVCVCVLVCCVCVRCVLCVWIRSCVRSLVCFLVVYVHACLFYVFDCVLCV